MCSTPQFLRAVATMVERGDCDSLDYCLEEARRIEQCCDPALLVALYDDPETLMVLLDPRGTVLAVNDQFLEVARMARDDLLGRCIFDLYVGAARTRRERALRDAFRTGDTIRLFDPGQLADIVWDTEIIPHCNAYASVVARQKCETYHAHDLAGVHYIG